MEQIPKSLRCGGCEINKTFICNPLRLSYNTSMSKKSFPFGTHVHPSTNTVFFAGKCEHCGGDVQEPNAVGIKNWRIAAPELIQVDELPAEIWHCDETGGCVCDDCGGHSEFSVDVDFDNGGNTSFDFDTEEEARAKAIEECKLEGTLTATIVNNWGNPVSGTVIYMPAYF